MSRVEELKRQARQEANQRRWRSAIELYGKAVSAAEQDGLTVSEVGLYNRIGDLHLKLDDVSTAVDHYLLAVDAYAEAQMYRPAVALCRKILRVAPDRIGAHRKLARLHVATGLRADARQAFQRYLTGVQERGELPSEREELEAVAAALMDGEFDAAEFRTLWQGDDHEEAFDLLLESWAGWRPTGEGDGNGRDPTGDGEPGSADGLADMDDDVAWVRDVVLDDDDEDAAARAVGRDQADPGPASTDRSGTREVGGAEGPASSEERGGGGGRTRADADVDATDAARELAADFGVDLADVDGSGVGGRILKADVEAAFVRGMADGPTEQSAATALREGDADEASPSPPPAPRAPVSPERPAPLHRRPRLEPRAAIRALRRYRPPRAVAPLLAPEAAPLRRRPRVEAHAAIRALRRYRPPRAVAPLLAPEAAPLRRRPRVEARAAIRALRRYRPPRAVAPLLAPEAAPLRRRPPVEPSAAIRALRRYRPPRVVAPLLAPEAAPLRRRPLVDAAAATKATAAYEPPVVVVPWTTRRLGAALRRPRVSPSRAVGALAAYEQPSPELRALASETFELIGLPPGEGTGSVRRPDLRVSISGGARRGLEPQVETEAAREALRAFRPPLATGPVVVDEPAPLERRPRLEPGAAIRALRRYRRPRLVAPLLAPEAAPLRRRPRVGARAAIRALVAYEPPLAVAPIVIDGTPPLERRPRVDPAAAIRALVAHEPPRVVAPIAAPETVPLRRRPPVEPSAAIEALRSYRPPALVVPWTGERVDPALREPRVGRAAALDALAAHEEPSSDLQVLADETVELIGLSPGEPSRPTRGPSLRVSVSDSPRRDLGPQVGTEAAREALRAFRPPAATAPVLVDQPAPMRRRPRIAASAAREALAAYEPPLGVAPVIAPDVPPLARRPRIEAPAVIEALAAYEPPLVVTPRTEEGIAPLLRRPTVEPAAAFDALAAHDEPSADLRALAAATFELIGLPPGGPKRPPDAPGEASAKPDGLRIVPRGPAERTLPLPEVGAGTRETAIPREHAGESAVDEAAGSGDVPGRERSGSSSSDPDDAGATGGGEDAAAETGVEPEASEYEPPSLAGFERTTGADAPPDFTVLLEEIGWLGNGNGSGPRSSDPSPEQTVDRRGGDGRSDALPAGAGDDAVPDERGARKSLAPWAIEPREPPASVEGAGPPGGRETVSRPEELDFTDLLRRVGWLQEDDDSP